MRAGWRGAARRGGPCRIALLVWTAAASLPLLLPGSPPALWVAALVGSAASATTFPFVESYLTAGRHGAEMRSVIGKFNLSWTPATALPLLLLPLLAHHPAGSFAVSAATSGAAWLAIHALPEHPAPHGRRRPTRAWAPSTRRCWWRRRGCSLSAMSFRPRWRRSCRTGWPRSASARPPAWSRRSGWPRASWLSWSCGAPASGMAAGGRWRWAAPRW